MSKNGPSWSVNLVASPCRLPGSTAVGYKALKYSNLSFKFSPPTGVHLSTFFITEQMCT